MLFNPKEDVTIRRMITSVMLIYPREDVILINSWEDATVSNVMLIDPKKDVTISSVMLFDSREDAV